MLRLTTRSRATAEAIRDRQDFTTSGALRGENVNGLSNWDSGYLRGDDRDVFNQDAPYIKYVVWSYGTPIAWWSLDQGWYVVKAKFSPTTSKHQGNLYLIREG